jgi:hypothetical protein
MDENARGQYAKLWPVDARDRSSWRWRIHGVKQPTRVNLNIPQVFSPFGKAVEPTYVCVLFE